MRLDARVNEDDATVTVQRHTETHRVVPHTFPSWDFQFIFAARVATREVQSAGDASACVLQILENAWLVALMRRARVLATRKAIAAACISPDHLLLATLRPP